MLTKKHFSIVAQVISYIRNPQERKEMAEKNAKAFSCNNPRFDKTKFFKACGVPTEK